MIWKLSINDYCDNLLTFRILTLETPVSQVLDSSVTIFKIIKNNFQIPPNTMNKHRIRYISPFYTIEVKKFARWKKKEKKLKVKFQPRRVLQEKQKRRIGERERERLLELQISRFLGESYAVTGLEGCNFSY